MGIEIPICQNINHNNKKYTYINKPVFVFIVILSSLKRKSWLKGFLSGGDISLFSFPLWNILFLLLTEKNNVVPFDDVSL